MMPLKEGFFAKANFSKHRCYFAFGIGYDRDFGEVSMYLGLGPIFMEVGYRF